MAYLIGQFSEIRDGPSIISESNMTKREKKTIVIQSITKIYNHQKTKTKSLGIIYFFVSFLSMSIPESSAATAG